MANILLIFYISFAYIILQYNYIYNNNNNISLIKVSSPVKPRLYQWLKVGCFLFSANLVNIEILC